MPHPSDKPDDNEAQEDVSPNAAPMESDSLVGVSATAGTGATLLDLDADASAGALPEAAVAPDLHALDDVQAAPVSMDATRPGRMPLLKVDVACVLEDYALITGWSDPDANFRVLLDNAFVDAHAVRIVRADVARHLRVRSSAGLGFAIWFGGAADRPVQLAWTEPDGSARTSAPLVFTDFHALESADVLRMAPELRAIGWTLTPFSDTWRKWLRYLPLATTPCRGAKGYLEFGSAEAISREGVVLGWEVHDGTTPVWLEDDEGTVHQLDGAYRRFRQDVHDLVGNEFPHGARDAGFVSRLAHVKAGSLLQLKVQSEAGVHVLSETRFSSMAADPVAAARWLFGIGIPVNEFHSRVSVIDVPVLEPLIAHRQHLWEDLPVRQRRVGAPVVQPVVSVIVPLYGRIDFVEHQLIEFAADGWFQEHAELIYVVDDARILEGFVELAETLYRQYKVPFQWVWGSTNRGFSGANNLGVTLAAAPNLLFLNSDAFPQAPGWLEKLIEVLEKHPDIGAVGPRLVFADGSIQHGGMEFRRREELGIWVNHHPRMGLDPALDPHDALTRVPAVTGACVALRRADLDRLGGWDTGYLIGDFEDSDLCLKIRAQGQSIGYLPTVQLTHLERQSFKLLGQDDFRQRVVIYNAVRHQERWRELLSDAPVSAVSTKKRKAIAP